MRFRLARLLLPVACSSLCSALALVVVRRQQQRSSSSADAIPSKFPAPTAAPDDAKKGGTSRCLRKATSTTWTPAPRTTSSPT